ncbi:MAG: hypothetical protein JWM58_2963 [Rhizobium sp.]|nr:hypothetical protein [Rhizobium sp.]
MNVARSITMLDQPPPDDPGTRPHEQPPAVSVIANIQFSNAQSMIARRAVEPGMKAGENRQEPRHSPSEPGGICQFSRQGGEVESVGDPCWIRTSDHLLRRQVLYPAELRDRSCPSAGTKLNTAASSMDVNVSRAVSAYNENCRCRIRSSESRPSARSPCIRCLRAWRRLRQVPESRNSA